jgi:hypothetical protein
MVVMRHVVPELELGSTSVHLVYIYRQFHEVIKLQIMI